MRGQLGRGTGLCSIHKAVAIRVIKVLLVCGNKKEAPKLVMILLSLLVLIVACSQDYEDSYKVANKSSWEANAFHDDFIIPVMQGEDNGENPLPSPATSYTSIGLLTLPQSSNHNVFGNWLNNTNIVFHPLHESYYFSLPNKIDGDGTTINDLGFQMRLDENMSNLTKLSNNSFERLHYSNGRIFYISNGQLISRCDYEEITLVDGMVLNYRVENNTLYYILTDGELWVMDINSSAPSTMLPINLQSRIFQIYDGKVFFVGETGIYVYADNEITLVYKVENIIDFLIDGVLVYRARVNGSLMDSLIIAGRNYIVVQEVKGYTIVGDILYYSTWEGLFAYDLINETTTLLIPTGSGNKHISVDGFHMTIESISVFNNKMFMKVKNSRFRSTSSLVFSDLQGRNISSMVDITQSDFQTFTHFEGKYTIPYPVGMVINSDAGSRYGSFLLMNDPKCSVLIKVDLFPNIRTFYLYSITDSFNEIEINQGHVGLYRFDKSNGGFKFRFIVDEFTVTAEGNAESLYFMRPILYEMIKGFEVLEKK